MRDRISREKKRKDKAATKIQALIRRKLATVIVDKRRKEVAEEKRLQEKLDDLEKKLEELHSEWLEEIIVIRAQTGVRGMLGRKAFVRKSAQMIKEAEEKFLKKKIAAAVSVQVTHLVLALYINLQCIVDSTTDLNTPPNTTHIYVLQAVMRGCLGRKRFVKALPGLIHASQMRLFCVECEKKVATRRCIDCRDKYCVGCYTKLHQKGARKFHSWLPSPGLTREQRRIIQMHNPQVIHSNPPPRRHSYVYALRARHTPYLLRENPYHMYVNPVTPLETPSQHTLSTHPLNIFSQSTLSMQPRRCWRTT